MFRIYLILVLVFSCCFVYATPVREIVMTDGSIITGQIISLKGGHCTIKSSSLGKLVLDSEKIETIRKKGSKSTTAADNLTDFSKTYSTDITSQGNKIKTNAGINSLKNSIMTNPEALNAIMGLQNNPSMQAVMNDPAVMEMIRSGDFDSLMKNQKIINLMNNPALKDIKNKITK